MKSNVLINADRLPLDADNRKAVYSYLYIASIALTTMATLSVHLLFNQVFITLFSGALFLALSILAMSKLKKRISTGYISNHMVIIKLLTGKNFVMEFKCIKNIESKSFLGWSYCKLHFKFDGVEYQSYVFGTIGGSNCREVFNEAKRAYKEMKKASHKPGSVHSAS